MKLGQILKKHLPGRSFSNMLRERPLRRQLRLLQVLLAVFLCATGNVAGLLACLCGCFAACSSYNGATVVVAVVAGFLLCR